MEPTTGSDYSQINLVLNAIQTGGLISFLVLSVMAFLKEWVYPAGIVKRLYTQVEELTQSLALANDGMKRMADAWEARNDLEKERREWDRRGKEGA